MAIFTEAAAEIGSAVQSVRFFERAHDGNWEIRLEALKALNASDATEALPVVKKMLRDPVEDVRMQAAINLVILGSDDVFWSLLRALEHKNKNVIVGSALTLGKLRDKRAIPYLISAFKTNEVESGAAIAWALGQLKSVESLPWLIVALHHKFVALNVCEALGNIGDEEAFDALECALSSGVSEVRAFASRSLGMLQYQNQKKFDSALHLLRRLVCDSSRKVRLCAALGLFELEKQDVNSKPVANLKVQS